MTVRELMKILDGMNPGAKVYIKDTIGDPFSKGLRSVVITHKGAAVHLING